jgi:glycosyltransferase involved in cell wall biosynthesis
VRLSESYLDVKSVTEVIKLVSPKVSICIPTYKQPSFFKRTLYSVFIQDYKDYEVIITDDSPDDCIKEIIKEFPDFEKLSYYKNEKRKGSPGNWNEAIDHAKGEYIKILHHDDWFFDKNSLNNFVKLLEKNTDADFAFSSSQEYGPERTFRYLYSPTKEQINKLKRDPFYLFLGNFIGCPSATIYKRKINKLFDSKLKYTVDLDFYIRVLKENPNFIFCPEPLVCITEDAPHQVTRECAGNKNIEIFEWIYLYNKNIQSRRFNYHHAYFIYQLLNKYNITSPQELIELGIEPPISKLVESLLFLNKISFKIGTPINYTKGHLKNLKDKILKNNDTR